MVLANLNGQAPDEIARKLAAVAHGEKVKAISDRKEITVSPAMLARYVGTYEFTPKVNMRITPAGNQLMGQLSGQGKLSLFPESETLFFLKVVDAQLEFSKDAKGVVTDLILHLGGRDQKAIRSGSRRLKAPVQPSSSRHPSPRRRSTS